MNSRKLKSNSESRAEVVSIAEEVKARIEALDLNSKKAFVRECHVQFLKHQRNASQEFLFYVISLNETVQSLQSGEKNAWYLEMGLSPRSAQKKTLVAKKLGIYKTVQLDVFTPSQLIRIAEIKDRKVIEVIVSKGLLMPSTILDLLNPRISELFVPSDTPEDIEIKLRSFMDKSAFDNGVKEDSYKVKDANKNKSEISSLPFEALQEHSKSIEAGLSSLLRSMDSGSLKVENVEINLAALESSIAEIRNLLRKLKESMTCSDRNVELV